MMYSLLDRYIGKTVLCNVIVTLFVLISLSSIIKFIDELRKVGRGCYFFLEAGIYVFFGIVKDIELFLPVAILLGSLLGLGILLTRNELIVMELFGFSRFQIVFSLIKIAFPIILFGIFINEWAAPMSERAARSYRHKMLNNTSVVVYDNLWVKDGNNFVYVKKVVHDNELFGVYIFHFDEKYCFQMLRYVACAKFINGVWNLLNVSELYFNDCLKIVESRLIDSVIWSTSITPNCLSMVITSVYYSTAWSIFDLYPAIQFFKRNGQNVDQYQLYFWRKILFPISVVVMMLMALSYILKSMLRKLHVGVQILFGIFYSFFFIS